MTNTTKLKLRLMRLIATCLFGTAAAQAALIPVTSDIAAGTTVTWRATNEYRLNTIIYVQTNATLIIEPGTVIKGATNVTVAKDGIPELVSALWVTRGGKIIADGTRENPIIFTAEGDNLNGNIPPTQSSLWGGVVIMGNAVINSAKDTTGNVANPKYDVYEGVTGPGPNNEHRFGGNNDADDSGTLRYVSIRHAGRIFAPAAELNCLTLAGVGHGTTLEYIEVFAGSDDGVEWWGGTASANHVVAAFIEDDDFDTDQGYRGTNQFWFGIKPTWIGTADSRGIESDGDLSQSTLGESPVNRWTAWNVTLIGRGKSETSGGLGVAWNTRDEDAANVFSSLFVNWNQGLRLDADGLYHYTNAVPLGSIRNNVWDVNIGANTEGNFLFTTVNLANTIESALLGGISYSANGVLDPRPQPGSPAIGARTYRGAFSGPSDDWADGWTALSKYGYLKTATPDPTQKPVITITADIAAGSTVTWRATNEYHLNTIIYVQTNATLIIEPGTVIKGATNVTVAKDGIPELVSALWVTRGGKIIADGTRENPIIFTAEGDNLNGNIPPTQSSLWGGVVIMGNAVINSAKDTTGNVANPKYDVYEGVTGPGPNNEHRFGGNNDADDSGILRYVSIRHAGRIFAPAAELNCLTLAGVGHGTTLEYIEVFAGSDDGIEWWGGTASANHVVAAFIEDDDFDTDQGYRGTNQFWFGIKPTWIGTADSRGIESDGDLSQSTLGELPVNKWTASNVTLIGRGKSETSGGLGVAWNTRDEDAANVLSSLFVNWNQGLRLDADGLYHYTNAVPLGSIRNNVWDVNIGANTEGNFLFTTVNLANTIESALLGGISYSANGVLDPRPQPGSPAIGARTYRGAFSGPSDDWADGWTALSKYGYLKTATPDPTQKPVITITADIAAGSTVTWRATNEYHLNTIIYVQTNATLIIEPGTVIKGATNVTVAKDGIPELVSALWVTRGGKIIADGTRENPIIFTAEGDNLNGNIPPTQSSLWGGVVIMGNAVINSAKDTTGNVANPKYDVYEGVTGPGPNNEHRFGGNNDADDSGILRYVSIRHAGRIFAPAAELNCLTLAGVGHGTTLEYIEVFAGSDDGIEWWGGTASANHVVAAFIEDDDFDTDQGYRGTNQFWFGIKPTWIGTADSRGIESDGDLSQSTLGELPVNKWTASNVTLIGRGKSETSGGLGVAWNTRDEDAANVLNSVFANWNQGLRLDADGLYHYTNAVPLGSIRNNVWDVNVQANTEGNFIFTTTLLSNVTTSAVLGGISYTNNGVLDPRPQPGSPLLGGALAGGAISVSYRGAFAGSTDDWADDWTALSRYGYLKPAEAEPIASPILTAGKVGSELRINFFGSDGVNYQIESSTDFVTWSPLGGGGSGAIGSGQEVSLSFDASTGFRFYRVRATE